MDSDKVTVKFKDKYRIASTRLSGWDYSTNAAYFISICAKEHASYFGHIYDGIMNLNAAGQLAQKHWQEIPEKFEFAALGEFVVMPNHMHGIIIINKPTNVETRFIASPTASDPIRETSTASIGGITGKDNPMLHENIARIVRWFKGRTTFEIRKLLPDFAWQALFYDHIIRNNAALERMQNYILNNPLNWKGDKFYR
ncbi:transposase [Adhaeribacter soli]|uniref:Transposase n=1 Tax=Adhaeribacter soli TaxID=2607655 RepID=A0A5N1IST9_9BACT|nr:transposase [Adhaeribacter soli]KAA9332728.1 transposase [Adhaeribacter soli]